MFALALALVVPTDTARAVRESAPGRTTAVVGVVTFAQKPARHFYLADATGGVRVEWPGNDRQLRPGDAVRVTGTVAAGPFQPLVEAFAVACADPPPAPRPHLFNLSRDESDYLDAQWVETEAVVLRVWVAEPWLKLDLARGRSQAVAYVPVPQGKGETRAHELRGAVVRVRGVWERTASSTDPSRLLVQWVSHFREVRPPADLGAAPERAVGDLARPRTDPLDARLPVRVSGVVVLNLGNKRLFVRDGTGTAEAILAEPHAARTGEHVAVAGFPRPGATADPIRLDAAVVLEHAPSAHPPLPDPVPGTAGDAVAGKLNGQVVKLGGTVLGAREVGPWSALAVQSGEHTFTVVVLGAPPGAAEVGGTVEATGTVSKEKFPDLGSAAFVLFAVPRAVALAPAPPAPPPPWWTGTRVARLSAGLLGLLLFTGASATVYRARVRRAALERGKLEGRLQRAARFEAVGQLAGGVIHDFNNVLTVITGAADELTHNPTDPAQTAALAGAIGRAGEHGTALARQLLNVVRQRAPALRPTDLNATVADTAGTLVRLMGDRVAVSVTADPNLSPVLAEGALVLQIVLNLAVNARDAMPNGGTFALATSAPAPGVVRLTATDTGTGMTPDVRDRAFEPGFTTKGADSGTGLGLYIVARAVEALGGTVRVRSELGRGTTFEIDLPAAPRA